MRSNQSYAVPFNAWAQGQSGVDVVPLTLNPGTSYTLTVAVTLEGGAGQLPLASTEFHTQFNPEDYSAVVPMWAPETAAQFVMLRRVLPRSALPAQLFLAISAKPSPDWNMPHQRNTSHLLCAYKLWVNGVPLGTGPGRRVGGFIAVGAFETSFRSAFTGPPPPLTAVLDWHGTVRTVRELPPTAHVRSHALSSHAFNGGCRHVQSDRTSHRWRQHDRSRVILQPAVGWGERYRPRR